jgi:mRNA-degrading endonuclease RelE of RelBE toxin-antitoxin system
MKISKDALKALKKMPKNMADRFFKAFDRIEAGQVLGLDIKSMAGHEGYFRLRIGPYRAIYTKDMELIVIRVGPRGDVYK